MDRMTAPPSRSVKIVRLVVAAWGASLMLLSVVATVTRASLGESQPRVKMAMGVTLGVLFALGGVAHFVPAMVPIYVAMIPPAVPAPAALVVAVSGVVELAAGAALAFSIAVADGETTPARVAAAWMVVVTLILIFPANVYMAVDSTCRTRLQVSRRATLARLPLQGTLLVWAHWYTR